MKVFTVGSSDVRAKTVIKRQALVRLGYIKVLCVCVCV